MKPQLLKSFEPSFKLILINITSIFYFAFIMLFANIANAQNQTRTVVCKDSLNNVVADALCPPPKPIESQACPSGAPPPGSCSVVSGTTYPGNPGYANCTATTTETLLFKEFSSTPGVGASCNGAGGTPATCNLRCIAGSVVTVLTPCL